MSSDDDDLAARIAATASGAYDVAPDSELKLVNRSENTVFALTDAATGEPLIMRVHRHGYHERHQIESELDWLAAIRADGAVSVPQVRAARDGTRVVTVDGVDDRPRQVVCFEQIPGVHPDENLLTDNDFHHLGRITAALHDHARRWRRPPGFDRFAWDWESCLGQRPRWGRWQDSVGVGPPQRRLLGRAQDLLEQRLRAYGCGADRFGLMHADLRLANLLVHDGDITAIDFDDCGFSWFFYDFGAAVSFIEDDPALPRWQDAWLAGYRTAGTVSAADEEMLASFVMLRRLKLLAWMGTHDHALESRTKLARYAEGSCELAECYLTSGGRVVRW
ncbi:phosphotransferase enzyme family protein [[Mycobacterium] wendilense]|uniref:Phosphotransferase n=1 Tax=[Mycobacterium] wendilense TaxID=3064284 RepID=A0ABM9MA06_9MYCO|nr:phosphotransferase [Mycolicibacterium sp. MU0050]CAJ1580100.1 phosphotransferase [Mycolicibacterium sp. MU0050]